MVESQSGQQILSSQKTIRDPTFGSLTVSISLTLLDKSYINHLQIFSFQFNILSLSISLSRLEENSISYRFPLFVLNPNTHRWIFSQIGEFVCSLLHREGRRGNYCFNRFILGSHLFSKKVNSIGYFRSTFKVKKSIYKTLYYRVNSVHSQFHSSKVQYTNGYRPLGKGPPQRHQSQQEGSCRVTIH